MRPRPFIIAMLVALLPVTVGSATDASEILIEIKVGQSVELAPSVSLGFSAILADSRCPSDAVCVWEGDGHAAMFVDSNGERDAFELHTSPMFNKTYDVAGYRVTMIEVRPYPALASGPIDPADYVVVVTAFQIGASTPVTEETWGRIKALYN